MNYLIGTLAGSAKLLGDGKVDLIGIFGDVFAPGLPAKLAFDLAFILNADVAEGGTTQEVVIYVIDPDGTSFEFLKATVQISSTPLGIAKGIGSRVNIVVSNISLEFAKPGPHVFELYQHGKRLGGFPVNVILVPEQNP